MSVGLLRLVSLFAVALLAWTALGCASAAPTPAPVQMEARPTPTSPAPTATPDGDGNPTPEDRSNLIPFASPALEPDYVRVSVREWAELCSEAVADVSTWGKFRETYRAMMERIEGNRWAPPQLMEAYHNRLAEIFRDLYSYSENRDPAGEIDIRKLPAYHRAISETEDLRRSLPLGVQQTLDDNRCWL